MTDLSCTTTTASLTTATPATAAATEPAEPAASARTEANRRNARRSTGPRTAAGKQRSSVNRWRHGLTAARVVAPDEDPAAYDAYRHDMRIAMDPANALEEDLVERITVAGWKRRRIEAREQQLMENAGSDDPHDHNKEQRDFDNLLRYRRVIDREYHTCIVDLDRMQKNRDRRNRIEAEGAVAELSEKEPSMRTPFGMKQWAAFTMAMYALMRRDRLTGSNQFKRRVAAAATTATSAPDPEAPTTEEDVEIDESNPFNRMVLSDPAVKKEDCLVTPDGLLIPPLPA
ncbi:MAG: hypothetical protein AB7K09_14095 [Planctomycetota bacterium]